MPASARGAQSRSPAAEEPPAAAPPPNPEKAKKSPPPSGQRSICRSRQHPAAAPGRLFAPVRVHTKRKAESPAASRAFSRLQGRLPPALAGSRPFWFSLFSFPSPPSFSFSSPSFLLSPSSSLFPRPAPLLPLSCPSSAQGKSDEAQPGQFGPGRQYGGAVPPPFHTCPPGDRRAAPSSATAGEAASPRSGKSSEGRNRGSSTASQAAYPVTKGSKGFLNAFRPACMAAGGAIPPGRCAQCSPRNSAGRTGTARSSAG